MNSSFCNQSDSIFDDLRHRLSVYIAAECHSCQEAVLLMAEIARQFPQLVTEIINLDRPDAEKPEEVFAVPTYVLDGKIISLGNPYPDQLRAKITSVLAEKARERRAP